MWLKLLGYFRVAVNFYSTLREFHFIIKLQLLLLLLYLVLLIEPKTWWLQELVIVRLCVALDNRITVHYLLDLSIVFSSSGSSSTAYLLLAGQAARMIKKKLAKEEVLVNLVDFFHAHAEDEDTSLVYAFR